MSQALGEDERRRVLQRGEQVRKQKQTPRHTARSPLQGACGAHRAADQGPCPGDQATGAATAPEGTFPQNPGHAIHAHNCFSSVALRCCNKSLGQIKFKPFLMFGKRRLKSQVKQRHRVFSARQRRGMNDLLFLYVVRLPRGQWKHPSMIFKKLESQLLRKYVA